MKKDKSRTLVFRVVVVINVVGFVIVDNISHLNVIEDSIW